MTKKPRRAPRAFALDEPVKATAEQTAAKPKPTLRKPRASDPASVKLHPLPDDAAQRVDAGAALATEAEGLTPPPATGAARRGFSWSKLFFAALAGLLSLAVGLWVDGLVRELFAREDWLGWLALALTALLVLAAFAVAMREALALWRMSKIDHLREDAVRAMKEDDPHLARKTVASVTALYDDRPDTAAGRAALAAHKGEIIDGSDLLHLANRDLMRPLDRQARALVMGSAKRVSVVTAVSPRALVDLAFVLYENMRLIRRISEHYGGRPGTLGFFKLAKDVLSHLAVTGSIAVGDGLLQQVVGHGVAAKLSTRLGEGVVNGLLTARIGIAAIDVCRPLPFSEGARPTISDFLGELTRFGSATPVAER